MRRISADTVLVAILAICAITTTALVARREFTGASIQGPKDREIAEWHEFARGGNGEGPTSSPVTLIVFSDFQCPYCRAFANVVDSVHANYPEVRIIERSFPLTSIHPQALPAAIAAACAARTGKYWAIRHTMFTNANLVEEASWDSLARASSVTDASAFHQCIVNRQSIAQIVEDTLDGTRLKVHATPTVMLNGLMFAYPPSYTTLVNRIHQIYSDRDGR